MAFDSIVQHTTLLSCLPSVILLLAAGKNTAVACTSYNSFTVLADFCKTQHAFSLVTNEVNSYRISDK